MAWRGIEPIPKVRKPTSAPEPRWPSDIDCPACGHAESYVSDSRGSKTGKYIRRRRECVACKHRFTSKERLETPPTEHHIAILIEFVKGRAAAERREMHEETKAAERVKTSRLPPTEITGMVELYTQQARRHEHSATLFDAILVLLADM